MRCAAQRRSVLVPSSSEPAGLWPLVLYCALVVVLLAGLLALSYALGERRRDAATEEPFESGIVPIGSARLRLSAKFYLVAMFFVIFDLEAVYLIAWAVALFDVGWTGFIEAAVFIFVLVAALVYLWRSGALDWAPAGRAGRAAPRARDFEETPPRALVTD